MRQMNELTELHNGGYQQGLSKITDNFSPIGGGIGYDKGAINTEKVLRPIASGGAAITTGGASLLGQLGIVAGGRAIDKLRGVNKSVVDQYIQDNKDGDGIDLGNNPSLRQNAIDKANQAEQEAILAERQKLQEQQDREALNAQLDQENAPPTPNSPQFTMEDATGLTKEQVRNCKFTFTHFVPHEDTAHRGLSQIGPASRRACLAAFLSAEPVLLEPMLAIEVRVPTDLIGNVSSVLQGKRGKVLDMQQKGATSIVIGEVPAVETFDISEKMRGQTAGKAMWNTHFKAWTPVPKSIAATLTEDIRKRKGLSPNPPAPTEFIDRD